MAVSKAAAKAAAKAVATPLYHIPLASGGAQYKKETPKAIRLIRRGCANRPFYHISVQEISEDTLGDVIEQVGVYDPYPNIRNEKIAGLNFERIQHWIDEGAIISSSVKRLLGLAGYLPIHPKTYLLAWTQRKLIMDTLEELKAMKAEKAQTGERTSSDVTT